MNGVRLTRRGRVVVVAAWCAVCFLVGVLTGPWTAPWAGWHL